MIEKRKSVQVIDAERKRQIAYQYLCHLEEVKIWLEKLLRMELPPSSELEEYMRNGVIFARMANFVCPEKFPINKIYDLDLTRYNSKGLHFRHTDNINYFLKACKEVGLPKIFYPETTDIYDMKNPVKAVFCLHALSHLLAKEGKQQLIESLYGIVEFKEEDLSKIETNLDKYGVKMPAFSKIGGMLASELSEDQAAIHAGVVLINEAIDARDERLLAERLKNPSLKIQKCKPDHIQDYMNILFTNKEQKAQATEKKLADSEVEFDVYDKILSQAEIQNCIILANLENVLKRLNIAVKAEDLSTISSCVIDSDMGNINSVESYSQIYADCILKYYKHMNDPKYEFIQDTLRSIILDVNDDQKKVEEIKKYVSSVNLALSKSNNKELIEVLSKKPLSFPSVDFSNIDLIYESLIDQYKTRGEFDDQSLKAFMKILSIVCNINDHIDMNEYKLLYDELSSPELSLKNLDKSSSERYMQYMKDMKTSKQTKNYSKKPFLTFKEIVECVDNVNRLIMEEIGMLDVVSKINETLKETTSLHLYTLLSDPRGKFSNVFEEYRDTYLQVLLHQKLELEKIFGESTSSLWHNNIQQVIDEYNVCFAKINEYVSDIENINKLLLDSDVEKELLIKLLKNIGISGLLEDCFGSYVNALHQSLYRRKLDQWDGWLFHSLSLAKVYKFYYNHKSKVYMWFDKPEKYDPNIGYLDRELIQEQCNRVSIEYNREMYFKSNEDLVIVLQNYYLSLVTFRAFKKHINFLKKELPSLIIIQSYSRMLKERRKYFEFISLCKDNQEDGIIAKSFMQTLILRMRYLRKVKNYGQNSVNVIAIQSLIRGFLAQNDYNNLINKEFPSLKHVYKYLNLLEFDANDMSEEREIIRLRNLVYDKIREVNDLEEELKEMDVRIGLIVKNRINLQETNMFTTKSKKKAKNVDTAITISKDKMELREKYGNMFYILQHNPIYVSRLLLEISVAKSSKFVKDFVFSLFNYGATSRDEYIMLKIFESALDLEIVDRIDTIQQFSKDDPMVIKLDISYWRDVKPSSSFLKDILIDAVVESLNSKSSMSTNPVEVYKQWINQREIETGQKSEMPYDVSVDKALEYEEVISKLKSNIDNLVTLATKFRDSIIRNINFIPYGIRYFAKCIYESLCKKFSDVPIEEAFKVVGNFLYYRFISPAIVSPDGFKLVPNEKEINTEQRRNLAAISSILQNSAANRLFESDLAFMEPLNNFMRETSSIFLVYFKQCIEVESLEQHYNMNEFTDQTMLHKPELRITCGQAINTHKLLVEYSDILFTSKNDILYSMIKDLGDVPKPNDLADKAVKTEFNETDDDSVENYLITLSLLPPKNLLDTEESRMKELMTRTVLMVIDLLRFAKAENIKQVVDYPFTDSDEKNYQSLLNQRQRLTSQGDTKITEKSQVQNDTAVEDSLVIGSNKTLAEIKSQVIENLKVLEEAKQVSSQEDYAEILSAIVQRIRDRTQYIKRRKLDVLRYRGTLDSLDAKRAYSIKQMESFNQYLKGCIDNMMQTKKGKSKQAKKAVKKTAAKLHSQGVIIEIDGLATNQFKNVVFEFSPTDDPGVFKISGKLLGITMSEYELVFQNLLHLKFNNVMLIKILDRIKVNVNLLIFFINKHFYHKK